MSIKSLVPEDEFSDPNDFYTEEESLRYENSSGMRKTQIDLTKIALLLSQPLSKNKNISILDIGCGTGFSLDYLREEGYTDIKGIDPSKEMVNLAKLKKLNVKLGGFQDLNKIYEKYDLIISISSLQWILSNKQEMEIKNIIKKISKDLKNILKVNGTIVIQFYPNSEKIITILQSVFNRFFKESKIYIHNSNSLKKRKFFITLKNY
jgi:SAM-dependent methyltransferase